MKTYFVSGHLKISSDEFEEHYIPLLEKALSEGAQFVVGDARGTDAKAQQWLSGQGANAVVYHMFENPRNNVGNFPTKGGFESDSERDTAMTQSSDFDIAWVRPGRESSGTAKNLARRKAN